MWDERQRQRNRERQRKCWAWVSIPPLCGLLITSGIIISAMFIMTPSTASVTDVEPTLFYYYHRNDTNQNLSREGVAALPIRPESSIYFYIHGFQSPNLERAESLKVKDAILEKVQDVDVVVLVDWCDASYNPGIFGYTAVVSSTLPIIAVHVKDEIKWIEKNLLGMSGRSRIRMAGHSLGAHIMGRAGELLYAEEGGGGGGEKIKEMVGLDPAGPLFDDVFLHEKHRLSRDDADHVLCIHTDDTLGTSNRSFCHYHLYPSFEICWIGGFMCRHNSAKELFIQNLSTSCSCLQDNEVEIGWLGRGMRWISSTRLVRKVTIAAMYATWLAVLYAVSMGFGLVFFLTQIFFCGFSLFCNVRCYRIEADGDGCGQYCRVRTSTTDD